jgi:hypothetical protein
MLEAKAMRTNSLVRQGEWYEVVKIEPKGSYCNITLKGVEGIVRSSDLDFYSGGQKCNIYYNPKNRLPEVDRKFETGAECIRRMMK